MKTVYFFGWLFQKIKIKFEFQNRWSSSIFSNFLVGCSALLLLADFSPFFEASIFPMSVSDSKEYQKSCRLQILFHSLFCLIFLPYWVFSNFFLSASVWISFLSKDFFFFFFQVFFNTFFSLFYSSVFTFINSALTH